MVLENEEIREEIVELLEGIRERAENELMKHHRRLTLAYEKLVKPRMFEEGKLVLKVTDVVMKKQHVLKWAPNWDEPYVVQEAHLNGSCTLFDPEEKRVIGPSTSST
ncbi:hypothetical protein SESBI_40091 [Sesbania bispinosa]|nr:hypothetical protein SESBI_40091 [Sesbania bispinosa]